MQGKLVTAFPQGLVCVSSCLQVPDVPKFLSCLPSMTDCLSLFSTVVLLHYGQR